MRIIHAIVDDHNQIKDLSYKILGRDCEYCTVRIDSADPLVKRLDKTSTEPILFLTPLTIPLDYPNMDVIDELVPLLEKRLNYVRLCRCGNEKPSDDITNVVFTDHTHTLLHVPYLIREQDLRTILTTCPVPTIIKQLYWYSLEPPRDMRGGFYWNPADHLNAALPYFKSKAFEAISVQIGHDGKWTVPNIDVPALQDIKGQEI